jgi:hypothetical protein
MAVYRYSPDGVEFLFRKAVRQSRVRGALGLAAVLAITVLNSGFSDIAYALPMFAVLAGVAFWKQKQSSSQSKNLLKSVELEIDDDELTGSNSLKTVTIRREEVSELRHLRDGILVRGRDPFHTVQAMPELDGYSELAERIETWVPSGVVRKQSSRYSTLGTTVTIVGMLVLIIVAFSSTNPIIAIPCCLAEAAILIYCWIVIWRSKLTGPMRRLLWLLFLPFFALLGRAYMLWNQ